MANEFKHVSVGTDLSQAEWESTAGHVLNSQATGDLIYASSASQLTRLGIGSTSQVLTVSGGLPAWAAGATSDVVLAGSSTVATATTSLTPVTLVTISGLSIPVATPFRVEFNGRKQALSASTGGFGITLNSTVVLVGSDSLNLNPQFDSVNQAEQLYGIFRFGPRSSADYLFGFGVDSITRVSATGAHARSILASQTGSPSAAPPNDTITSVAITGSNNAVSVAIEVCSIRILTGIF